MTEKLFYKDSHLSKFKAEVLSCVEAECRKGKKGNGKECYEVELDRTAFFPEGGGQYADTGVLCLLGADVNETGEITGTTERAEKSQKAERAGKIVRVLDVCERDGRIFHVTDGCLEVGTSVEGRIDWEERFMKMQQHTGEHIVSGLIHAAYGYHNVGFHLGSEDCTMDFDGELTEEQLRQIEAEANEAVWKNLKVLTHYPKKEELSQIEYRSKIEIEGQVRIIEIPGYDCCACCAPHTAYTGEIGIIKLVHMQRYKGGVRITMLCGVRALADYVRKENQTKEISRLLCAKEGEIAEAVVHLSEEVSRLKYELSEKEKHFVRARADMIPKNGKSVCIFTEEFSGDSMRILMNFVLDAGHPSCAVFYGNDSDGYRYVLGSRQQNVRDLAKEFHAQFDGRGGGKPEMVQGTVRGEKEKIEKWLINWEKEREGR